MTDNKAMLLSNVCLLFNMDHLAKAVISTFTHPKTFLAGQIFFIYVHTPKMPALMNKSSRVVVADFWVGLATCV